MVTLKPLYLPLFLVFSSPGINSPAFFFSIGKPAACFRRIAAGGVLMMNSNDRSEYTEITTGSIMPLRSWVLSLNCLTKAPIFTPCAPSAGPTGGAGVAWPPGHCNLTCAVNCFAICLPYEPLPIRQLASYESGDETATAGNAELDFVRRSQFRFWRF